MNFLFGTSQTEQSTSGEFVTTSEAAELCHVTRFTIRNWILGKKLKASSTGGRHHRILRSDLLEFMREHGIRVIKLSRKAEAVLACWEHKRLYDGGGSHRCNNCLVFKERMKKCFLVVREFGSERVLCGKDCWDCAYMETYFPKEKCTMESMRARHGKPARGMNVLERDGTQTAEKALMVGFYRSGKYIAAFKHVFAGKIVKKLKK